MTDHPSIGHPVARELRHAALTTGVYTGGLLSVVMIGALVAANRIPGLERFAVERNAASYGLFVMFMLIPVARFLNRPFQMYLSAMLGWVIFVVAYNIVGIYFQNLFESLRHTPFVVLIEGAVVYGVFAVGSWVGAMVLHARTHPILPRRRRTDDVAPHHQ